MHPKLLISARTMQMAEKGGSQLCPSFLLPFCLSLPLIQAQSNGRNVNEQSINANVVHSISIPSLSVTEICGPLSPFLKKMCLEEQ